MMHRWFRRSSARQLSLFHGEHERISRVRSENAYHVDAAARRRRMGGRLLQDDREVRLLGLLVFVSDGELKLVGSGRDHQYGGELQFYVRLAILFFFPDRPPHPVRRSLVSWPAICLCEDEVSLTLR